jgi:hypothetical protein
LHPPPPYLFDLTVLNSNLEHLWSCYVSQH